MIIITPIIKLTLKIATILFYLATIFSCYGGYISPHIFPLSSVAVIAMPVMVTLSAIITIIWFCTGSWIIGGAGVGMFLLCLSPIRMWFPFNHSSEAKAGEPVLTVLTWNVLHGKDLEHPDYEGSRVLETILRLQPDVVCMQELYGVSKNGLVKFSQSTLDSVRKIYPYEVGNGSSEIHSLSKYPVEPIKIDPYCKVGFAQCFIVKHPAGEIAMANIHLPSFVLNDKEREILDIRGTKIKEKETLGLSIIGKMKRAFPFRAEVAEKVIAGLEDVTLPTVICGDFNDVPASWTYRLFLNYGFIDAYDATNFLPTHTFYTDHMYVHLDQVFYRGGLSPLSVERINVRSSDHIPLLATFRILDDY